MAMSRLVSICSLVVTTALLFGRLASSLHQYKFQTFKTTWHHAEELCRRWGGNLVTITSARENQIIRHEMEIRNMKEAWIGLNDRDSEGGFEWVSRPFHRFFNWNKHEPSGNRGENCGEMLVVNRYWRNWNGEWNDISCNEKRPFACKKVIGRQAYYKYYTSKRTWSNAKQTCHSWGGFLLIIDSRHENEFIAAQLKRRNMEGSWLGLNDKDHEGIYDWADRHWYIPYNNFQRNEPNGRRHENCVQMVRGKSLGWTPYHGQWNDQRCDKKYPAICEKGGEENV